MRSFFGGRSTYFDEYRFDFVASSFGHKTIMMIHSGLICKGRVSHDGR